MASSHSDKRESDPALRVKALESIKNKKGLIDPKALDQQVAAYAVLAYLAAETDVDFDKKP